ncbi:Protein CBG04688 [Caenorhabditis briggsae]|uniref:T20D4.11-like domain-containing protein n=2 Tax=Caenorhabditis briggsae TaxID=6238 RepID=A0AAE9A9Y0_CAEBR|nr:Protein CBG04688 [Caenorhabditis briggsae]ULT91581.1 hypothetical protein L3Y34_009296 [Caenorhabditis briggsae]CAP25344.1 Protein CBG04688 [Caenorhabditis briggsae]
MKFSIFILSLLLVACSAINPKDLPKCETDEELFTFLSCLPETDEMEMALRNHKGMNPPVEVYKRATKACENILACLAPLNCQEAQEAKLEYEVSCELLTYLSLNLRPCLAKFFTKAYLAQFSSDSSCLKDYSFLDKDLTKRRDAYINGKSCFLETIRSVCNKDASEYYTKSYRKFVTTISIKPAEEKCSHPHYQFNSLQCKGLEDEITLRVGHLKERNNRASAVEVSQMIQMCKDAQKCMKESCVFSAADHESMGKRCKILQKLLAVSDSCSSDLEGKCL